MPVYLDYNATTPLRSEARAAMLAALEQVGNPSSVHSFGRQARAVVEEARRKVASAVGSTPEQVIFTSGGTEANALALRGSGAVEILVSATAHDSARRQMPCTLLPVLPSGLLDLAAVEGALARPSDQKILSVEWVNNETGIIQPVAALLALCRKYGALLHLDAVQALGRIALDVQPDYLTLSAHKIGGPQGSGALVVGRTTPLAAQLVGGGQERGRRAGTENVAAIAGFGAAIELAVNELPAYQTRVSWRDHAEAILMRYPAARIVGAEAPRVANTICVVCSGLRAEMLLMQMDLAGYAVSSGAACSSGKVTPSHVLSALGIPLPEVESALRLSFGWKNSEFEVLAAAQHWTEIAKSAI